MNLPSAKDMEPNGIDYEEFLQTFINAVEVDYKKLRKTGSNIASKLDEKKLIHVHDPNGTNLLFSIKGRRVEVEVGTLEDCFSIEGM